MTKLFKRDLNNNAILIYILILAALLRFIGTNPGYNQFHSDEGITYSSAIEMVRHGNIEPERYDYPALVPIVNLFFFKTVFIPLNWGEYFFKNREQLLSNELENPFSLTKAEYKKLFQQEILGHREVKALHWGRYVTALISLGNVFLVFLLTKKLFKNKWISLIAAFFLAINFRAVTNAHIGLPDTYNAFFLLLALLADIKLLENSNRKNYIIAGIALGLSISVKYQFFAIFPFLLTHLLISLNIQNNETFSFRLRSIFSKVSFKKLFNIWFILAVLTVGLTYMIINPYWFAHMDKAIKQMTDVSIKYQMGRNQFMTYPFSYQIKHDYGYLQSILIIIGLIISLKKYFRQTLLLLTVIIPFYFVMTYYSIGGFYVRNFITITPLLFIFAAIATYEICLSLNKFLHNRGIKYNNLYSCVIFLFFLLLVIKVPLNNAYINSYYYTQPWDYTIIIDRVRGVIPQNARIVSHPFDPLPEDKSPERIRISVEENYSIAEFKEAGADYGYINLDWAGDPFYKWMTEPYPESIKYWNKPTLKLRNNYFGLSIAEMMNSVAASAYKPWQASDAALFLIKVPDWEKRPILFRDLKKFSFNDSDEEWERVFREESVGDYLKYDKQVGLDGLGSLTIGPGSSTFGVTRYTSKPIPVQKNHLYKVKGFIKSDKEIDKKMRNGFIRLDFYDSFQNGLDLREPGSSVNISERYFGNGWREVTVFGPSSVNTKFMTVSFQAADQITSKLWLDDVTVHQSIEEIYTDPSVQRIKLEDYQNLLYPESHGNL